MERELLDMVDSCDAVIGTILKEEAYNRGLDKLQAVNCFIRVINCFITNSAGKLWIPRRTAEKKLFPGALDVSIGGHVQSCESYHEAFFREALEEVRIDCHKAAWEMMGYQTPEENGFSAFMQVYLIRTDDDPEYNRDDFSEFRWIAPNELLVEIEQGAKAKGDLLQLLRAFFYDTGSGLYSGRVKNRVCL